MDYVCRIYLGMLSGYHIFTGIVSMFFPEFAMGFYKKLYRCEPLKRADLFLIMKPWGALAAFAGIVGCYAASDPVRYEGVIWALILLLVFRIYYRLVFARELELHANIPRRRNLISVAMIAAGVVILGVWCMLGVT
jgi:hypothetical protein